jgi:hypothetical protein
MTDMLLAAFSGGDALRETAHKARTAGFEPLDAFTPYPVEDLVKELAPHASHVRVAMFIGGIGIAALAYGLEWFSAVIAYPIDSGGRPLNSWPTFVMFPFAIGIFAAAVAGLITFFVQTGLPRLHYPLFEIDGFKRASQDRFLLAIAAPQADRDRQRARDLLCQAGAVSIWEVRQ